MSSYSAEGDKEAVPIQHWMEAWFQAIPDNRRKKFGEKTNVRTFRAIFGAMFELEIHEILKRIGGVIEIAPELPGSNGKVGFRVIDNSQEFYVEATVCGIGQGKLRSNENEHDAVEKLRKNLKRLHADLCLEAEGEATKSLGKEFVNPFQNLLDTHTSEDVRNIYRKRGPQLGSRFLSTEFREEDWVLEGRLRPAVASSGAGHVWGPARGGCVGKVKPISTALKKRRRTGKKER